ncbi:MAG: GNAT family N-acetyltransferase [Lachnospiraceae bacterium]|nr:GNAT family N-acetyltransferase [Lachnospiraceae bacterium]
MIIQKIERLCAMQGFSLIKIKKGMVDAMMKNSFCLKSDTVTITPSNMENLWESDWIISFRKGEREQLGTASFAGEKFLGAVPLNVELMPKYRNRGFGTEIIRMMVNWAFLHKNVFEVVSKVEHENDKGVYALQKAGFVFRGNEGKLETYSIIKGKTVWTGVYVVVGIFVGMILAIVINSAWLGFVIGLGVSLCIGAIMDNDASKYRESVTGKREQSVRRSKK